MVIVGGGSAVVVTVIGSDYIYDILGTNPFDAMAGVNFFIENGVGIIYGTGEEDGSNLVALTTTLTIRTTDGSGINSPVDVVITINPLPITVTATAEPPPPITITTTPEPSPPITITNQITTEITTETEKPVTVEVTTEITTEDND